MDGTPVDGMGKAQRPGMQGLTAEIADNGNSVIGCPVPGPQTGKPRGTAINRVADQRMSCMGKVNADLVCTPCFQTALEIAGRRISFPGRTAGSRPFQCPVTGDGMAGFSVPVFTGNRKFFSVRRMAYQRCIDRTVSGTDRTMRYAFVNPVDITGSKRAGQGMMGTVMFGRNNKAGGKPVYTVDDTGAGNTANARKGSPAMGKQGVDQRAVPGAGCRVHHHAGRLVDNNDIPVFIDNIQRNAFRSRHRICRRGNDKADRFARPDPEGRIPAHRSVFPEHAAFDQRLKICSADTAYPAGEPSVHPLPCIFLVNGKRVFFTCIAVVHIRPVRYHTVTVCNNRIHLQDGKCPRDGVARVRPVTQENESGRQDAGKVPEPASQTSFERVAAAIGARNLIILIMAMPVFFAGLIAIIILYS